MIKISFKIAFMFVVFVAGFAFYAWYNQYNELKNLENRLGCDYELYYNRGMSDGIELSEGFCKQRGRIPIDYLFYKGKRYRTLAGPARRDWYLIDQEETLADSIKIYYRVK